MPQLLTLVVDNDSCSNFHNRDDDNKVMIDKQRWASYQVVGDEQLNVSPTQLPFYFYGNCCDTRATPRSLMVRRNVKILRRSSTASMMRKCRIASEDWLN